MIFQRELRSPKRNHLSHNRSAILYHYYAGFSPEFVTDVLKSPDIKPNAIIMDPWNGSGTTTQVAMHRGFSAIGFDINPVMVIVAKAKLFNCDTVIKRSVSENLESLIRIASELRFERLFDEEPLESCLEPNSAECFRRLDRAIQFLMISDKYDAIYARENLAHITREASYFYLALFKTLRKFLSSYVSSNPTWIKMPLTKRPRIHVASEEIYKELRNQVHEMVDIINSCNDMKINIDNTLHIQIERASSELIPLQSSSIDLVISSPPYCTRIDYAIATSPELALLGCSMNGDLKNLRDRMIGTPTMINEIPEVYSDWGPTCRSFLNAVETHNSKASKSYYYRYYIQYFDSIYRSFLEIDRTLVETGKCLIVVQDSYYKDINNNLPMIFCEMADSLEWVTLDRLDFQIKQTMASRNSRTKKYRSSSTATESVLVFEKSRGSNLWKETN